MLGDNIKKYREIKGIGVNELARRVGVSGTYISGLEKNKKKNPSGDLLEKIATELDIKVVDLYREDDEYVINENSIPMAMKEEGVQYMVVAKEFMDSGLSVDEIRRILSAIKATKETRK